MASIMDELAREMLRKAENIANALKDAIMLLIQQNNTIKEQQILNELEEKGYLNKYDISREQAEDIIKEYDLYNEARDECIREGCYEPEHDEDER